MASLLMVGDPEAPFASTPELLTVAGEIGRLLLGRALLGLAAQRVEGRDGLELRHQVAGEIAQLLAGVTSAREAEVRARGVDDAVDRAMTAFAARLARSPETPLARLVTGLGLGALDVELLLALLAPTLEPALERGYRVAWDHRLDATWYAFLLGGLALEARLAVLAALAPGAPLRRHRLVTLGGEAAGRPVVLADSVAAFLRGEDGLDEVVAGVARVAAPIDLARVVIDVAQRDQLERALAIAEPGARRLLVWGPDGIGKATLVTALATDAGRAALRVDLPALLADRDPGRIADRLALCAREAAIRGAVLVLDAGDVLDAPDLGAEVPARLAAALRDAPGHVVIVAARPVAWLAARAHDLVELELSAPTYRDRIELWARGLAGVAVARDAIDGVAARYGLGGAAITRAAARAATAARLRAPARPEVTLDDLVGAARASLATRLGAVAQRIPAGFTWDDLVLPRDTLERLQEVVRFAARRPFLLEDWGFARKLPYGRGISAILAGPPGTGKTMVAQILARELGYELYRIDLSQLVNKYIGETEKNLARVFAEAEHSHAILFFDEADAMFAKRTEVKSSNDRYANLEVNYLLQRMETFDGVTLLATNLEQGLDDAFKRRVRFSIQFELPGAEERAALWRSMIPEPAPVADDVDWARLGAQFELAGGYIKKAVVRAALEAASASPPRPIRHDDLARAAVFEYRELGRVVSG